jgi:hypothetical protein
VEKYAPDDAALFEEQSSSSSEDEEEEDEDLNTPETVVDKHQAGTPSTGEAHTQGKGGGSWYKGAQTQGRGKGGREQRLLVKRSCLVCVACWCPS